MVQTHKASGKAAEKHATSERTPTTCRAAWPKNSTALRAIVEGTAHGTGEEFFQTLVRHLARAVDAHYAFVAEFASPETHYQGPHHRLLGHGPHRRKSRVDARGHAV